MAVVITWIVQRASSRTSGELQRVAENLEELVRRRRLDDLLAQLCSAADPDQLRGLADEGRALVTGRRVERLHDDKAHFTNPGGSLPRGCLNTPKYTKYTEVH